MISLICDLDPDGVANHSFFENGAEDIWLIHRRNRELDLRKRLCTD